MSVESFKKFVKERPNLVRYVNSKEKTWQDFYEMYELYGESSDVWNSYLNISSNNGTVTIKDLFGMFKNIDVSQVQESITSIQKGIGYIENLVKSKEVENIPKKSSYEARPMYRYFDD